MTSKIGIGTNKPQSPLSVSGGAAIGTSYANGKAAPDNGLIVQDKVGIGTNDPKSALSVSGGAAIGASYAGINPAPDDGLIVEGNVGIGTDDPSSSLSVAGDISLSGNLDFGQQVGQMLKLFGDSYGIGVQSHTTYFRTYDNFAWYKRGDHNNGELNAGSGGTAMMVLDKDGNLGLDTASPGARLDVQGNAKVSGTLDVRGDIKFGNTGQYFPLAGSRKFRIIAGSINNNGSIRWGTGFTCSKYLGSYVVHYEVGIDGFNPDACVVTCSVSRHSEDSESDVITFSKVSSGVWFYIYDTVQPRKQISGSFDFIVILSAN